MIIRLIGVIVAVLLVLFSFRGIADESKMSADPDLGTNIVAAAALDDRLWVLGAGDSKHGGSLVSFRLSDGDRQVQRADAIGMQKVGNRLFVLTRSPQDKALVEWSGGRLMPVLPKPPEGDQLSGIFAVGAHLGVETPTSLYVLEDSGWRLLRRLNPVQPPPGAFSADVLGSHLGVRGVPISGTSIYSGFNQGEWGGELSRVDLATGAATSIESHEKGPDGEALYDSGLGPVNAIIADPSHPDCVVVAVGLIHFEASGRLLRVCRNTVSLLLAKVTSETGRTGTTIFHSEAFFGLVPTRNGFWAVSNAAVYRFGLSGEPERYVLSRFEPWHGLVVSHDAKGALVLVTEVNRRFSVNNGTPLIVPLD